MRKLVKGISTILLSMALVGCNASSIDNENVVNISILNSKPELQAIFEEAINKFEEAHPDINIKIIKYNQSQPYQDKLVSMQEYGNTPTMILMDPTHMNYVEEDNVSLNEEKWMEHVAVDLSDIARNDEGELIAFPFALEGIGLIYNEEVLNEAGVDPSQINTLSSLEEAFKKIEAIGKGAIIIANEDWSLANHLLPIAYSVQGNAGDGNLSFIEALKNGTADIKNNVAINGLLDTFDVMKAYNYYKDAPLTHVNAKCAELIGKGDVGFYYMGNWASSYISAYSQTDSKYGFVPVPISNQATDYGNQQITAVIKYLVVEGTNSSQEQQEAAKKFIDWLVFEQDGQDFMVNKAKVIPGVDNNQMPVTDDLMNSIIEYQKEGKIIELNNADLPDKNAEVIGGYLRKYLNNEIHRLELLESIEKYWKDAFA
ncbi:MAG: carbohydrate ABC transporter substrate-binding protein [Cellulosilyticum sp.]|nr:carbohydrate ABC transporter substrate-binding protein [Cellulosilyticum sp.]